MVEGAAGMKLYVYSSGSVEAQRLLFSHTAHGDLTPLFSGYFDTTTGPKLETHSYQDIARSVSLAAREQGGGATGVVACSFDDIHLQK